ncbi:MAG: DNA-3-methyladenine glycosylase 2 family protein [Hyphomicrobiales bacterium]|jgi:DNA-3-methyladenine glycosylase II|nr:DNA-3-methyladenine glycosylase 2 family protein [Hyphomicrobiales bacterium]
MQRRIETDDDIGAGLEHLVAIEPRFRPMIDAAGTVPLRRTEAGFAGLCRIVVAQQVSVASAKAIWGRVQARFPALGHGDIAAASQADLRACGLSGPKIRTFQALAGATASGGLDFSALAAADAATVHAAMTAIKGIGPWTTDIYLMFGLGHADAFAPGDLALREAVRIGFGLGARPSTKQFAVMAEAWSPWRAVAARLLWAYYAAAKQRDGVGL